MYSTSADYNLHVTHGDSLQDSLNALLDNVLDKQSSKEEDLVNCLSRIPNELPEPTLHVCIADHTSTLPAASEPSWITLTILPDNSNDTTDSNKEEHESIPLQCLYIQGSEEYGEQQFYFPKDQQHKDNYQGIIRYGQHSDDPNDHMTYIFLYATTSYDAHERIMYRSSNSQGIESIRYISVPKTPYSFNAAKHITLDLHYLVCNFLAYLIGIPSFEHGIPVHPSLTRALSTPPRSPVESARVRRTPVQSAGVRRTLAD